MVDLKERWLPIVGYEKYYEVSNVGRVRSLDRTVNHCNNSTRFIKGKIVKNSIGWKLYYYVRITVDYKCKAFYVHRLMAIHFLKPVLDKNEINHKNGIKTDNRLNNIEWCNHQENCQHAQDAGLNKSRYSKHLLRAASNTGKSHRIISMGLANKIRKEREKTGHGSKRLSRVFNVTTSVVDTIIYDNGYL